MGKSISGADNIVRDKQTNKQTTEFDIAFQSGHPKMPVNLTGQRGNASWNVLQNVSWTIQLPLVCVLADDGSH